MLSVARWMVMTLLLTASLPAGAEELTLMLPVEGVEA